eukprot:scaffold16549_cov43-Prasinocladus_malaysianus.AAC.2
MPRGFSLLFDKFITDYFKCSNSKALSTCSVYLSSEMAISVITHQDVGDQIPRDGHQACSPDFLAFWHGVQVVSHRQVEVSGSEVYPALLKTQPDPLHTQEALHVRVQRREGQGWASPGLDGDLHLDNERRGVRGAWM